MSKSPEGRLTTRDLFHHDGRWTRHVSIYNIVILTILLDHKTKGHRQVAEKPLLDELIFFSSIWK